MNIHIQFTPSELRLIAEALDITYTQGAGDKKWRDLGDKVKCVMATMESIKDES